jgi:hypothetical protein
MTIPILSKLYKSILENKINVWIENHGKRTKDHIGFKRYHSTIDHFVTFMIIIEEFHNNKTNPLHCFIDFRKCFDIVPRTSLWNRLEEPKFPF